MAKAEGTYIWVADKNVFGYISTNFWPFFMIQRPTIRGKCVWVSSNTLRDERPVFFGFSIFRQTSQLATEKIQNLCNHNRWSGLLQLGSVWFRSFFQFNELDLRTLGITWISVVCHPQCRYPLAPIKNVYSYAKWYGCSTNRHMRQGQI